MLTKNIQKEAKFPRFLGPLCLLGGVTMLLTACRPERVTAPAVAKVSGAPPSLPSN